MSLLNTLTFLCNSLACASKTPFQRFGHRHRWHRSRRRRHRTAKHFIDKILVNHERNCFVKIIDVDCEISVRCSALHYIERTMLSL